MHIFVAVRELGSEFVGISLDFSRPPSPDVIDGVKDFLRGLLYQQSDAVVLIGHCSLLLPALFRHERRKLALERFDHSGVSPLGQGPGYGIRSEGQTSEIQLLRTVIVSYFFY